jgi:hypothetical protein
MVLPFALLYLETRMANEGYHEPVEEKEHAAMVLEWIRRKDPAMDKELKDYLFTEKEITHA